MTSPSAFLYRYTPGSVGMVRIFACRSMAREIYSIGWQTLTLWYKKPDESFLRVPMLAAKAVCRRPRADRFCIRRLHRRCAKYYPRSAEPVVSTRSDEVSGREEGRSRARCGASQRPPL